MSHKKILYFAYCANMLSNRMECCVHKSVVRKEAAKLEGYKMEYGEFSKVWYGTLPTIVKNPNSVVWGCLWELQECYKHLLDELQGVGEGIYKPINVELVSQKAKGGTFAAMTYQLVKDPPIPQMKYGIVLKKFRPSMVYQEQLIEGAREACLPLYYRKWLMSIRHNGYTGSVLPNLDVDIDPIKLD
uniref:gamma-glutamylcyclotransferase n=1 Tax=Triatoma infestans TaxID=30076 RepID=A0A171A451_TRIIF